MPNIEIHGYGKKASSMKAKVRAALGDLPDAENGEIVTTTYSTEAEDFKDRKAPYLRVIASLNELPEILERLEPLNEDTEVLALYKWIAKKPVVPAPPSEAFLAAKKRLETYTVRGNLRPEERPTGYRVYDTWRDSMMQQWEHHLFADELTKEEAYELCR